ncbi:serine/threonine-protein kinase [Streptomyces canus]|uniref:serine/threonine-protein kinase n=1 Tax=Streptomyces canus TaxID=58343 RepID=UPI00371254C3
MRIGGRYRLTERVGQGGMGRVWRARDEVLERPVAVKELYPEGPGTDADAHTRRERALREARAGARIDHPGVVCVYDVAEEDDRLWIVMELIEAPSLERTVAGRGPLGVRETARIGLAPAQALRRVHAAGVLHRDVKPGNVLMGPGQRVVLTDFGIAALQDAQALTRDGMLIGSPEYMPPERATGAEPGTASDWWSLGATLGTALTGPLTLLPPLDAGDAAGRGLRGTRTAGCGLPVDAAAARTPQQGSGPAARGGRRRGVSGPARLAPRAGRSDTAARARHAFPSPRRAGADPRRSGGRRHGRRAW